MAASVKTFMDDVLSVLTALSEKRYTGDGLVYCAQELLARWNTEAQKPIAWLVHASCPYAELTPPVEGGLPRTPLYAAPQRTEELTLRDKMAAACLPVIYQTQTQLTDAAATCAYEQADEMLKARAR